MKTKLTIIIVLLSIYIGCNQNDSSELETQQVDLEESDHLKLEKANDSWTIRKFIETHPESELFDSAIIKYFRLYEKHLSSGAVLPPWHCDRSCRSVLVDEYGQVLYDGTLVHIDSIPSLAYELLLNKDTSENSTEFRQFADSTGTIRYYSKGHFELIFTPDSAPNLQTVVFNLREGINRYKSDLAIAWYGSRLEKINNSERQIIDSLFAARIVFTNFMDITDPPPPPSDTSFRILDIIDENDYNEEKKQKTSPNNK
jgi:hypothetical protein